MKPIWFCVPALFISVVGFSSSQPLFKLSVITKAPINLARNASASALYSVTNSTRSSRTLTMQAIQGITQVTTTTGACASSFTLASGQSCLLNLRINGGKIPPKLIRGPVVCQLGNGEPYFCSQPNPQESLNIIVTRDELIDNNTWISVLVAQDEPPADINTYVRQIHALAPAAEQIHVRLVPILNPTAGASLPIYQFYADLIAALRTAYATSASFQVGFHPDNSKGSETYWGCVKDDWQCVLNDSIIVMNNINVLADPNQDGQGFNIFSIEQSYLEPVDPFNLQAVKACLNPAVKASGAVCPVATIASPVVKYGDVLPSYGDSTIYGTEMLDYGYPQYYNLVERIQEDASVLISSRPDSYFPPDSAANCINSAAFPYNIIDANLSGQQIPIAAHPPVLPLIPCFTPNVQPDPYPNPANDVYTYKNSADPILASAYAAYLMTQLAPISQIVDTHGSTVYITFSGEPQFLGATGWTMDKINAFNQQINTNFSVLNTLIPGIIPPDVDTRAIKYAIWNFTAILANNP